MMYKNTSIVLRLITGLMDVLVINDNRAGVLHR